MAHARRTVLVAALALVFGSVGHAESPGDTSDPDARAVEAGSPDGHVAEAGSPDDELAEAGSPDADLAGPGSPDAGVVEAGDPDADVVEAGSPDAAPRASTPGRAGQTPPATREQRALASARARATQADAAYAEMLRRGEPRGLARQALIDERDEAQRALEAAERATRAAAPASAPDSDW